MGERREAESAEGGEDEFTRRVIGGAIAVHRVLGCGLLESAYAACLEGELKVRGFAVRRQVRVPVRYGGVELACAYRIDMLIDGRLILELKAVESVLPLQHPDPRRHAYREPRPLCFLC